MKIAVLGANGKTGRAIVELALDRGHEIVAAVRRPETMSDISGIEIVEIAIDDPDSLSNAFKGADAVISTLGHGGLKASAQPTTLYSDAVRNIREAMWCAANQRLVVLSSGGVVQDDAAPWFYKNLLRPYLMNTYIDMARMETILEETQKLQWTSVRLTYLLEGKTKPVIAEEGKLGRGNFKIHFQDAAYFILVECIEEARWIGAHPVIGYDK